MRILMILMIILVSSCAGMTTKYPIPECPAVPQCTEILQKAKHTDLNKEEQDTMVACLAKQRQALEACIQIREEGWNDVID